ncbi:hydrolase 1, exosortase A system-associated [Uliginosibacterium sp. H3]|uniref:Hydrolase 1, exosortase A system-associated n=1 Tax=Uliginosibacterium silvisoli TaxID=3114758 RepID=A0ABU6K7G8_9RHOO|nr:hydrolase 1, exosortase A system-associated [Uliginosibacterium sp. H3]
MSFEMTRAALIEADGQRLVATLQLPSTPGAVGVVFVTGGHQVRAGSHRQFLRLARNFAAAGYPCLRFDLPGLGDSEGVLRGFEDNVMALRAAIDLLQKEMPSVERIVLWGLCDGASAAALYAPADPRVAGLLLANPWVRTGQVQAKTLVASYYRRQMASWAFWRKVFTGRVGILHSGREWLRNWRIARQAADAPGNALPERLLEALHAFKGVLRIVIAEHDLTGQEFLQVLGSRADLPCASLSDADHTFSSSRDHQRLAEHSLTLLGDVKATARQGQG